MKRREILKSGALLSGITISGAALSSLMSSCSSESRIDWEPQFFTPKQAESVSAISDLILPRTDTPGALDLKVDIFVDLMCAKHLMPSDQEHVRNGAETFEKNVRDKYGKRFPLLTENQRIEVLKEVADQSNKFNPSVWGSPLGVQEPVDFFRRVKQFTLLGFYTSEEVGKNILVFDPIPMEQKGCIPVEDVGNAWTL